MKILIVTQYFWPETFRINDIAKGLVEKGHEVTVYTGLPNYPKGKFFDGYGYTGPYRENWNGVSIVRAPLIPRGANKGWQLVLNYLSFFILGSVLAPFLCKGSFDRIFVCQLSPVTGSFPAIILKWFKRAPIYFWVTDLWPETLEATGIVKSKWALNLWGRLVKFMYDQSECVLVSSKGFIEKIKSRGISPLKIVYWPQWGEDQFLKQIQVESSLKKATVPEGFVVMFAGNIGTSQAFETIVEAAKKLKQHQEIKWVILGDGLQKAWVANEIEKHSLQETFFLLGSWPSETMPYYYSKAQVLLATLKKDPLFAITVPAKIQSYLPSGKPLLVSMDGEGAELVRDSQSGLAGPAGDAEKLAANVLQLYETPEVVRREMGQRGRAYFLENFERGPLLTRLEDMLTRRLW